MPPHGLPVWMIVFWLFVVGAAVGSFLNVVVYRLPLGISLVYPPSRCPRCGKHIAWYDNIPIFGWVMLRGRCRQCHNPISVRYPIIEAITATMFAVLAIVEVDWLGSVYPFHLLLLCTLLCAALIELDGGRPPVRLFAPVLLAAAMLPLFWPDLRLIRAWSDLRPLPAGAVDGLAGLAVGAILCGLTWLIRGSQRPIGLLLGLLCVGLVLGWQLLIFAATFTAIMEFAMWLPDPVSRHDRVPATFSLCIFTFAWIIALATLIAT
jgi:leader peptidase (prepilin peptidase) / N-methyltransferase